MDQTTARLLGRFNNDQPTKDSVKAFIENSIDQLAVEKARKGESTQGIQEAHLALSRAFKDLERLFKE